MSNSGSISIMDTAIGLVLASSPELSLLSPVEKAIPVRQHAAAPACNDDAAQDHINASRGCLALTRLLRSWTGRALNNGG